MKKLTLLSFSLFVLCSLSAQVLLPKVITNNMVLQRGKPVAIWGTASPNEKVTVEFANQTKTAVADTAGNWQVKLAPMKASAEPRKMIISGSNTIDLENVLVGEVWLCSGQSNMEYPLDRRLKKYAASKRGEDLAEKELKSVKNQLIRFLYVERKLIPTLPTDGWKDTNDTTLRYVSAAGYFFAKELADKLKVPVGIISTSWGGTRVEQWTPPTSYQDSPLFKDSIAGKTNFTIDGMVPGKMFESMVRPIIPYTIKGLVWYQGESNLMVHDTATFVAKTKLMLDTWKGLWKDESLRFYYTQIAPYYYSKRKDKLAHGADLLPYYWEAQAKCLQFPNSGMVVTTDLVDDLRNIHPGYKWEVGHRLSLWALAKDYGKKVVYSGPLYKSMKVKKNTIELEFTQTGSGLTSADEQPLNWFTIAGSDRKFVPAQAVIKGKKVIVSSEAVASPVAVRFAWDETAMPNFCNKEKLPASPFRTDNWK
ncbi:MAG TPA: sialate O-acetylesterase [Paludibacter sp.]|nr:sialate O-acetylesterase [Paludibacter sp.]